MKSGSCNDTYALSSLEMNLQEITSPCQPAYLHILICDGGVLGRGFVSETRACQQASTRAMTDAINIRFHAWWAIEVLIDADSWVGSGDTKRQRDTGGCLVVEGDGRWAMEGKGSEQSGVGGFLVCVVCK